MDTTAPKRSISTERALSPYGQPHLVHGSGCNPSMEAHLVASSGEAFREERSTLSGVSIDESAMDTIQGNPQLYSFTNGLARRLINVSMHRSSDCCSMVEGCTLQAKAVSGAIGWHAPRNWMLH